MESQTNWCDLPVEMMLEIIKNMDFESRMNMRATARLEKELVEYKKMDLESVEFTETYQKVYVNDEEGFSDFWNSFGGPIEKILSLIQSLVNFSNIKILKLSADRTRQETTDSTNFLENITAGENFKFPILVLSDFNKEDLYTLFKRLPPGTQRLVLYQPPARGLRKVLRDPMTINVLLGMPIIQIQDRQKDVRVNSIIDAWIEHDQSIGKKLLKWLGGFEEGDIYAERDEEVEEEQIVDFLERFADRYVSETEKSVRIKMNDDSKHILLRIMEVDDEEWIGFVEVVAVWQVIPADLPEDEYEESSGFIISFDETVWGRGRSAGNSAAPKLIRKWKEKTHGIPAVDLLTRAMTSKVNNKLWCSQKHKLYLDFLNFALSCQTQYAIIIHFL